ncbi:hypothetical protein QB898_05080 [Ottowia sp. 10c7w1]|uniref:Uncharacterized protein n=2 Tax=Ottowia cancrivicina TaxID=3040346 RepID=A0AAW6RNN0_9BURK|nr:hypothetical protein [Ottowia sp. 10c7w1]
MEEKRRVMPAPEPAHQHAAGARWTFARACSRPGREKPRSASDQERHEQGTHSAISPRDSWQVIQKPVVTNCQMIWLRIQLHAAFEVMAQHRRALPRCKPKTSADAFERALSIWLNQ